MPALYRMLKTEFKLFAREPMAMFWGLVFPTVLLLALGLFFPGGRQPSEDLGGLRLVDIYMPVVLALSLATLAFATLPAIVATYRQHGILRRLATTPVHPWRMVAVQLVLHVAVAVVSIGLSLAVGAVVFDIPLPANVPGFVIAIVLAAAALLAVGLLIGAVAPSISAGQGIGMAVYFPMLFFAGVYFPRQAMPPGLLAVSDVTPSGAAVAAIQASWSGLAPATSSLVAMAVCAVTAAVLAARLFRWE